MSNEAVLWLGVIIFVGVLLLAEAVRIIAAWREFRQMRRALKKDNEPAR